VSNSEEQNDAVPSAESDRSDDVGSRVVRDGLGLPEEWEAAATGSCQDLAAVKFLLPDRRVERSVMEGIPHPVLSRAACDAICARIRRDGVIPAWRPAELEEAFEPFHKWKKVIWYVPWVVLGNMMSGPMCVELQGLSIGDRDASFMLAIDVDEIEFVPAVGMEHFGLFTGSETQVDPHWRSWHFQSRKGDEMVAIFEFQPDPRAGFHLEIAQAILEVQWPVIERNRDSPFVVHLPDDPEWLWFDSLQDVVAWAFEKA